MSAPPSTIHAYSALLFFFFLVETHYSSSSAQTWFHIHVFRPSVSSTHGFDSNTSSEPGARDRRYASSAITTTKWHLHTLDDSKLGIAQEIFNCFPSPSLSQQRHISSAPILLTSHQREWNNENSNANILIEGIIVHNTFVIYDREDENIGFWNTNCSDLWMRGMSFQFETNEERVRQCVCGEGETFDDCILVKQFKSNISASLTWLYLFTCTLSFT
ncbi:hypothetical protein L2E82_40437 [Cichorium intybus]|uniref:Uncharacterized protein n=1 Tax=Cichorium intybus TaxID=13427 RepID=A0ACB9ALR9_CICIN|nr:hypothetical protein L2E82_40437 [Cichorium intybus]